MATLRVNNNIVVPVIRVPVGIPMDADSNGVYGLPTYPFVFKFPDNATTIENIILKGMFSGVTSLVGVDFNNITIINIANALSGTFRSTGITGDLDLSSITTVNYGSAMSYAFFDLPGLTSIDLSSLQTIDGSGALAYCFALQNATGNLIQSVSFPALTYLGGTAPLRNMFNNRNGIVSISFPALTSNSFGTTQTVFDNMIFGVSNCTVHFPSNLQSVIGSWSSIQSGMGGSNTTVLFDLPATE